MIPCAPSGVVMSTESNLVGSSSATVTRDGPYDQFLLFGDSITQFSNCQEQGFAFAAALQDGNTFIPPVLPYGVFLFPKSTQTDIIVLRQIMSDVWM